MNIKDLIVVIIGLFLFVLVILSPPNDNEPTTTRTVIDYKTYVCTTYDDNTMECKLESRG